jgi:outer membrane protein assembly factor BamB
MHTIHSRFMFYFSRYMPAIFLLLLVSGIQVFSAGVDWYRWRGPDLNGISKETGWFAPWPAAGPKQIWKAAVGHGYSSVSISNGRLYTMGTNAGQETVTCLDANTGKLLWNHSYPYKYEPQYYEGGSSSTPTVDGDNVYTLGQMGELFCFEAASGKVLWNKNIAKENAFEVNTWGFASSPLIEGNLLIVNAGTQGAAFDKTTGKVIWTTGTNAAGYSSLVPFEMAGKRALALMAPKALVAVDKQSGKELWQFEWKNTYNMHAADPIVQGTKAFISSAYGGGCALIDFSALPPKEVWKNKNMQNHLNTCVFLDGYLYGVDGQSDQPATFKCLDWNTGEVKWSEKGLGLGAFMVADGKVIILSEKGELVIAEASPAGFKALSRAQVLTGKCWTAPVLSQGKIYCRNSNGDLVCIQAKAE